MLAHHPDPHFIVSTEFPCHCLPAGWEKSSSLANGVCWVALCRTCVAPAVLYQLLLVTEDPQKQLYRKKARLGCSPHLPILSYPWARSVKEAFLSLGAKEKNHHCFFSCFNSWPLSSPNCVRVSYLQVKHVGETWERQANFLAASMLCNPGKGTSDVKSQWELPIRSGASGPIFKSMVMLKTDSEAPVSGKLNEMHLLGVNKPCLPS